MSYTGLKTGDLDLDLQGQIGLKGTHVVSKKNWDKTSNLRVITLRNNSASETMKFYR